MSPSGPDAYPTLLSPLRVGALTLRNRLIMGSMHTGLEEQGDGYARLTAFYAARARGGVGLIVSGGLGVTPEALGLHPQAQHATLCHESQLAPHQRLTKAVHGEGALMLAQLLHVGRYDHASGGVSASALPSPLSRQIPRALDEAEIEALIEAWGHSASLARAAGYDGVEIMGGEGYLINQFLAPRSNQRQDRWGGSAEGRWRFALRIVNEVRKRCGPDFLLMFRLSLLDLVEDGSPRQEVLALARALQEAGVDLLNGGFGWHEARVPTVATLVPRAAFAWATRQLREAVDIPVVASNRINRPELAEALLARGDADLVSMARPLLADAELLNKAASGRTEQINTCIACNQSCLDAAFEQRPVSCLVNPMACRETEWQLKPAAASRRIAVVGAGPAGLACASTAAACGHAVTLFEAEPEIGGQFQLARRIPGKEEFLEPLRYWQTELQRHGVELRLGQRVTAAELGGYAHVVLATGVRARRPEMPGMDHPKVLGYAQAIRDPAALGRRVAVIGAGGIGFDVAELLSEPSTEAPTSTGSDPALQRFLDEWGIDRGLESAGGLREPDRPDAVRQLWLLQRSPGTPGRRLARSTGWIRRMRLQRRGVQLWGGVEYLGIDDAGLHLRMDGELRCLPVDQVVICAGQHSVQDLAAPLREAGLAHSLIGGAELAEEIDARRAIEQGVSLGLRL